MSIDEQIVHAKQCRKNLDENLQLLKNTSGSREQALAVTKLQECIMWLGMRLKALNEMQPDALKSPNPYPSSYDPTNTKVEPTADGLKL